MIASNIWPHPPSLNISYKVAFWLMLKQNVPERSSMSTCIACSFSTKMSFKDVGDTPEEFCGCSIPASVLIIDTECNYLL